MHINKNHTVALWFPMVSNLVCVFQPLSTCPLYECYRSTPNSLNIRCRCILQSIYCRPPFSNVYLFYTYQFLLFWSRPIWEWSPLWEWVNGVRKSVGDHHHSLAAEYIYGTPLSDTEISLQIGGALNTHEFGCPLRGCSRLPGGGGRYFFCRHTHAYTHIHL